MITALAKVDPLSLDATRQAESGEEVVIVLDSGVVTVSLGGLVDVQSERARLGDELDEIKAHADRLSARLKDKKFLSNAPEEIVEGVRDQLEGAEERRTRIAEVLARLGG